MADRPHRARGERPEPTKRPVAGGSNPASRSRLRRPRQTRIARQLPQALIGQSLEAGVLLARRFARLARLPGHPLFPAIHGRLIAGESPYHLARWIQGRVPFDDPLGTAAIQVDSLERKLRRYRALMPRNMLIPSTHIDSLLNGAFPEIDVLRELAGLIWYQKQRIDQFAGKEKDWPLGITSEQQRKEVGTLADLLMKMRDTQIALGVVPGVLPGSPITNQVIAVGADFSESDPLSLFLANNPSAIPRVMEAFDRLVAEGRAERDAESAAGDSIDSRRPRTEE
jgi:hypothetical protein